VVQTAVGQMINSIAERGVGIRRTPDGSIVIHPGAGSANKCWPIDRFIELAGRFRAEGRRVRFIIGEVERERWTSGEIDALRQAGDVTEPANYLQLLDALQPASLFVGNDSGPSHLAAIIGVPTFTLFGPTDPAQWKPLGPQTATLRHDPLHGLGVEEVYQWIQAESQKPPKA
jgi:ADP-heptose:LPS heptosyltransferase